MRASVKFLIGLAAVLLMGWVHHGPLGAGEALIDGLEARARTAVAASEVPGVSVALDRAPLARAATLSGPANDFQRNGMGEFPGLNDRVGAIEGIAAVTWADEPAAGGLRLPLLAETLLLLSLAYLVGILVARLLFGRGRRDSYLS